MHLTRFLKGNLNKIHWDRRVWEIGYRGPPLAQQKATGRPHLPVSAHRIAVLRERFAREWQVMRCLATPYLSAEVEAPYWALHGSVDEQRRRQADDAERRRMPGDVKRVTGRKSIDRKVANVGNLLHAHRTVEDSMRELINRTRFE